MGLVVRVLLVVYFWVFRSTRFLCVRVSLDLQVSFGVDFLVGFTLGVCVLFGLTFLLDALFWLVCVPGICGLL